MTFLTKVRELDRLFYAPASSNALDYVGQSIKNHYFAAASLSSPFESMTFANYQQLEKMMEAWYTAGKLEATGFYNPYDPQNSDFASSTKAIESGLFSTCTTVNLDGEDRVTMM